MSRPAVPPPRRGLRLLAVGVMALSLSGCISLLPKSKPSHLYRFTLPAAASTRPADATPVLRAGGLFQREASGDRILTVTGDRIAYIAQTRWAAPAEVLWDEAVTSAFESADSRVRLVVRGEPARADLALRLDVRNFETRYASQNGDPTVLVRVRALLVRSQTREQVAEQIFEASAPAERNRVGSIVTAYNTAVGKVLTDVVAWTNAQATPR